MKMERLTLTVEEVAKFVGFAGQRAQRDWARIIDLLKLEINPVTFADYFAPTYGWRIVHGTLWVSVPTLYFGQRISAPWSGWEDQIRRSALDLRLAYPTIQFIPREINTTMPEVLPHIDLLEGTDRTGKKIRAARIVSSSSPRTEKKL